MKKYFWETPDYWWMCLVFIVGFIGFLFDINGGSSGHNDSWWWTFYCYASFFYCAPALGIALAVVVYYLIMWAIKYIFSMCGKMKVSIKKKMKLV